MAFDQTTRNRLARFVSDARALLTEEFTRQLQNEYGLDPASGDVTPIDRLTALDDRQRETARILRETLEYYLVGNSNVDGKATRDVLDRIVREQAFTVLNRLCALRMSEARGLVLESIAKGYQSKGFQLYARLAGSALGETGETYRMYLFSLMDEFAVDLPVLFDRFSPQGRLFPREAALLKLLELINNVEIESLWSEDETIGWIYQYFNSKEERKAMRDASQAPRNSRELAVRNQFFTPRYVVEFLTDNTLGRIWYEMTRGETTLKDTCHYLVRRPNEIFLNEGEAAPEQAETGDNLSQEELLLQPVYIPHRPLKDPREIKMLDPACGSMHFGLYAFDLFEPIYAEAWELEARLGEDALQRLADLDPLHKTYPDQESYLKDVPRLIIERNIHGVDIDPRAVQIAGLSLWLRAQKSWQTQGLRPAERPQICKSNVVCAEPMPGDRQMLEEFLKTLRGEGLEALMRKAWHVPTDQKVRATQQMADALAKLVRTVWQEMELAGEAGSLLKIEETLRDAIATARKEAEEKAPLFRVLEYGLNETPKEQYVQLVTGEDQVFFDRAEELVLLALHDYANQADNGNRYKRRLFSEDTTRGFSFINLCRKRFDVVVMNPPFGLMGKSTYQYAIKNYPNSYCDFGIAFMDRGISWGTNNSNVGAITSRSYLSITDAEKFRRNVAIPYTQIVVDLGLDVMDGAWVDSSCQLFAKGVVESNIQFIRSRDERLVPSTLSRSDRQILRSREDFAKIPKARMSYDAKGDLELLLTTGEDGLEASGTSINRTGASTFEDERFRRLWWEVPASAIGTDQIWCYVAKSCEFNLFYYPYENLVKWNKGGNELAERNKQVNGQTAQARQGSAFYFQPGISFSRRGEPSIAFRVHPSGCLFSSNGAVVLPSKMDFSLYILGFLNSSWVRTAIHTQAHKFSYSVGHTKSIKWIKPTELIKSSVENAAKDILEKKRLHFSKVETDNYFYLPYDIHIENLSKSFTNYKEQVGSMIEDMKKCLEIINNSVAELYSFSIDETNFLQYNISIGDVADPDNIPFSSIEDFVSNILSYAIGCSFGRWNINLILADNLVPKLPDPFDLLPICPPGMLQNKSGLPAKKQDVSEDYPLQISWDGILVDDVGHPKDIESYVHEALNLIWNDHAEAIEVEACQTLGVRSLREYFQKPTLFFADHLKRYSKSRRAAPIYWPLTTPSCSYTLWLYYHRLNDQTLYTCVNDFVDPKLKQVSEEAARLRLKKGRSAADEKELERLTDFERELKDFREELLRVAKFWKPNLNDGVEITAAPLWKLFQHKPWQKRLKETWQKLEAGEYDWAHLAYSIWPERVREKCKSDKSLAIAHDLEALYVEPPVSAKKKKAKKQISDEESEGWFNDD